MTETADSRARPPTPGDRPGSWSSPRTPTTPSSGRPATAARWIDAGSEGWLVCCTSGDQGGEDPDADPLELAALRETEQRAAAAIIGYAGVTFLHQPDGALANDLALREQLVREIRTFRPDAVLATDPETLFYKGGGVNHTDHRAAGIAAVDAVYPAARNPMAFPWLERSGLAAHKVRRLYLFWSDRSDTWVDVSATLERKIEALARARQPDPRPGRPGRADPVLGGRGGRADRGDRRRGAAAGRSSTTTRTKDPADAPAVSPRRAAAAGSAPVVPDLGQAVGAPPEHRHHLGQGEVAGDARPGTRRRRRVTSRYSSAVSSSVGQWRMRIGSRPA